MLGQHYALFMRCHKKSYHDHKHDYHDDHHLMIIIIIIQVRESLNQATEFGAMPEDSEYPFPELIVLMGGLIVHFVNHFLLIFYLK